MSLERETKTAASPAPSGRILFFGEPIDPREQVWRSILRKEVIQPQVPLRLPCYDFTPVADPTVVDCLLAVSASPSGRTNSHGVTGGVYKDSNFMHSSCRVQSELRRLLGISSPSLGCNPL
jgi:hypothetical protein